MQEAVQAVRPNYTVTGSPVVGEGWKSNNWQMGQNVLIKCNPDGLSLKMALER